MSTPLQEFWTVFNAAWNRHDAGDVAALFEQSAQLSFIDGRLLSGRKAIEEFYRDAFAGLQGALTHEASVEKEAGSSGHGAFRILSADGNTAVLAGRYEIKLSTRRLILRLTLQQ